MQGQAAVGRAATATMETASDMEQLLQGPIQTMTSAALESTVRAETDIQFVGAHKYPRNLDRALAAVTAGATRTPDIARACWYSLPPRRNQEGRVGKAIEGPSVRLAEIFFSCWQNVRVNIRVISDEGKFVTVQAAAHDLENNVAFTADVVRNITTRDGRRFGPDMVALTINSASSIAFRNAIFRIIPRAYVDSVLARCSDVATGDAKSFLVYRDAAMKEVAKLGVPVARALAAVGADSVESMQPDELRAILGLLTSVREGQATIVEAFPVEAADDAPPTAGAASLNAKLKQTPAGPDTRAATGPGLRPAGADNADGPPAGAPAGAVAAPVAGANVTPTDPNGGGTSAQGPDTRGGEGTQPAQAGSPATPLSPASGGPAGPEPTKQVQAPLTAAAPVPPATPWAEFVDQCVIDASIKCDADDYYPENLEQQVRDAIDRGCKRKNWPGDSVESRAKIVSAISEARGSFAFLAKPAPPPPAPTAPVSDADDSVFSDPTETAKAATAAAPADPGPPATFAVFRGAVEAIGAAQNIPKADIDKSIRRASIVCACSGANEALAARDDAKGLQIRAKLGRALTAMRNQAWDWTVPPTAL